jgi:hypothetical protein
MGSLIVIWMIETYLAKKTPPCFNQILLCDLLANKIPNVSDGERDFLVVLGVD